MLSLIRSFFVHHRWVMAGTERKCSVCGRDERIDEELLNYGIIEWLLSAYGDVTLHAQMRDK